MVNIFEYLKKKGQVSGTVIAIILIVITVVIVVSLIIMAGQAGKGGILDLIKNINVLKHGGT